MVLSLRTTTEGTRAVLHVGGRLDLPSAAELRSAIDAELDRRPARLVLDLTEVEFLDSTGLGVLVAAQRKATAAGSQIVLAGARPIVERVLRITSVIDILPVHADVAAALAER